MAYITQLKTSGKWQAQLQRNGRKWSKTFDTKREAQQWALEEEARAKRLKSSRGKTFEDAADRYALEVSPTKDGVKYEVRRLKFTKELPMFKGMALADIDSSHIAEWRDHRLQTVKGSTVDREANLLRNLFRVARLEWKWIDHYPFEGVKLPGEENARHQVWPWQLIKRVLRAPRSGKTAEMQDAFHIALRTGMRLGEVLAAPEHFDKKRRVVVLDNVEGARKTARTVAKRRMIPIGRIAAKLLDRPPFTVGPEEGSELFSELCQDLLIDDLTFRDSRATALTHLSRKVDVMTLAKISGHKGINILQRVYYRETPESIAKRI